MRITSIQILPCLHFSSELLFRGSWKMKYIVKISTMTFFWILFLTNTWKQKVSQIPKKFWYPIIKIGLMRYEITRFWGQKRITVQKWHKGFLGFLFYNLIFFEKGVSCLRIIKLWFGQISSIWLVSFNDLISQTSHNFAWLA